MHISTNKRHLKLNRNYLFSLSLPNLEELCTESLSKSYFFAFLEMYPNSGTN